MTCAYLAFMYSRVHPFTCNIVKLWRQWVVLFWSCCQKDPKGSSTCTSISLHVSMCSSVATSCLLLCFLWVRNTATASRCVIKANLNHAAEKKGPNREFGVRKRWPNESMEKIQTGSKGSCLPEWIFKVRFVSTNQEPRRETCRQLLGHWFNFINHHFDLQAVFCSHFVSCLGDFWPQTAR